MTAEAGSLNANGCHSGRTGPGEHRRGARERQFARPEKAGTLARQQIIIRSYTRMTGRPRRSSLSGIRVDMGFSMTLAIRAKLAHLRTPSPAAALAHPRTEPAAVFTQIWVQAVNHGGERDTAYLQVGRGTDLSAVTAVETAHGIRSGTHHGVFTSGEILGPRCAPGLPGIHITDL